MCMYTFFNHFNKINIKVFKIFLNYLFDVLRRHGDNSGDLHALLPAAIRQDHRCLRRGLPLCSAANLLRPCCAPHSRLSVKKAGH